MFSHNKFEYIVIIYNNVYAEVLLLLFSVFGVSIYRNRAPCMQGLQCRTLARDLMSGKFGPASTKYHRPIVRSTRLLNTIDQSSKVPPRYQFESIKYFFPTSFAKYQNMCFKARGKQLSHMTESGRCEKKIVRRPGER